MLILKVIATKVATSQKVHEYEGVQREIMSVYPNCRNYSMNFDEIWHG